MIVTEFIHVSNPWCIGKWLKNSRYSIVNKYKQESIKIGIFSLGEHGTRDDKK